jgi:hypothetical protein
MMYRVGGTNARPTLPRDTSTAGKLASLQLVLGLGNSRRMTMKLV